jgi:hypothetical protein
MRISSHCFMERKDENKKAHKRLHDLGQELGTTEKHGC